MSLDPINELERKRRELTDRWLTAFRADADRLRMTAPDVQPRATEHIDDIVRRFPYWFTPRYADFVGRGERLPFDQHSLMALVAPRGPQWCCDKCQAIHAEWHPICTNCGSFDTLSWREPQESIAQSARGAELLPLLVQPAAKGEPAPQGSAAEPEVIDLAAVARSAD